MCSLLTSCSTEAPVQEQTDEPEVFEWTFEGNTKYEMVLLGDYTAPTEEQLLWFELHFYEVLEQAANNYPVVPVRDLLRTVLEAEGEEYRVLLSAKSSSVDTAASASHHDRGPEPTIMFYLPVLMDWYSYYDRAEDYEVALITTILHEYRHTQQDWGEIFDEPAPDWVSFGRESDAQWFVAENVLKPMRDGEQLDSKALTNYSDSLDAYLMANGDQNDPQWQNYVLEWTDFEDFSDADSVSKGCYSATYSNNNISFNYPCTWKVLTGDRFIRPVKLSSKNGNIYFYHPAESFAEYEETNKMYIEKGQISINETQLIYNDKTYQAKEYRQHSGALTLIEMDGDFIGVSSEHDLTQEEQEELNTILSSLRVH